MKYAIVRTREASEIHARLGRKIEMSCVENLSRRPNSKHRRRSRSSSRTRRRRRRRRQTIPNALFPRDDVGKRQYFSTKKANRKTDWRARWELAGWLANLFFLLLRRRRRRRRCIQCFGKALPLIPMQKSITRRRRGTYSVFFLHHDAPVRLASHSGAAAADKPNGPEEKSKNLCN